MTNDLSSPTCFAADGDDVYMGYAAPDELLTALKELRKLKCVGRRLASAVAESADDPKLAQLVAIHSEEDAHWVVVLSRHIQRLGGSADLLESKSLKPDDLSKCAIDIHRLRSRLVVRLEALVPRVRDDALHADLVEMALKDRASIARAENCRRGT